MRIVSLVPSWTETLLKAGVKVVGRTRFCIYPSQQITTIPIVGGTKDVSWDLVQDLKPDWVLFDKEENPIEMAEECPFPYLATHVTSLESLQVELARLGEHFKNPYLLEKSAQCLDIVESPNRVWDLENVPGELEWIRSMSKNETSCKVQYIIWKKPWMGAGPDTYIGSVLKKLGAEVVAVAEGEKYPVLADIQESPVEGCLYLFSSEPYPFHRQGPELRELKVPAVVVDGEKYSWFGSRSLSFLDEIFQK